MLNEFIDLSYDTKNEQAIQRCRWKKRMNQDVSQLKGSDRTLMKLYNYTLSLYDDVKYFTNSDREKTLFIYGIDMPYKTGKLKGQLTTPEIRKLIRAHNKLSKITIPTGSTREQILNIVKKNGYEVNHKKQQLTRRMGQPATKTITMKQASEVLKPKPKTALQQQKAQERKQAKELEQKKKERDIKKQTIQQQKQVATKVEAQKQKKAVQKQVAKKTQKEQKKVSKETDFIVSMEDILKETADDLTKSNNKGLSPSEVKGEEKVLRNVYKQLTKRYKDLGALSKESKLYRYTERIYNKIHGNPPDPTKNDGLNINMLKDPDFKSFKNILSASSKDRHANQLKKFKKAPKQAEKKSVMKTVKPEDSKLLQRKGVGSVPPPTIKSAGATKKITPKQPEKKISTDKGNNYQVKDDEIRVDFFDDKTNTSYKRIVYKAKDGFQKLLKLIKDKGYIPTKEQERLLKEGLLDYISNKKSLKGVDIKRGKGKTDMIIISATGHDFGSGIGSIRIKKSTPAPKKETPKPAPKPSDDEPELIEKQGDRRVFELKQILQKASKDLVKKFRSKAPTKAELKSAVRSISKLVEQYEEKNNVEFVEDAGEKIEDLVEIYESDVQGYKN